MLALATMVVKSFGTLERKVLKIGNPTWKDNFIIVANYEGIKKSEVVLYK